MGNKRTLLQNLPSQKYGQTTEVSDILMEAIERTPDVIESSMQQKDYDFMYKSLSSASYYAFFGSTVTPCVSLIRALLYYSIIGIFAIFTLFKLKINTLD